MAQARIVLLIPVIVLSKSGPHDTSIELSYSSVDPDAVEITTIGSDTPWRFHREILASGIVSASGEGDVRIEPTETSIIIRLNNGTREAMIVAEPQPLIEFLNKVYAIVPAGSERIEIPNYVHELLDEAGDV